MDKSIEKTLYKAGWILLPIIAAIVFLYRYLPFFRLPCVLFYCTGIYCPGCGGTRAVRELLHGHIFKAFYYHPFVPYCALLCAWFMISHTVEKLSGGKIPVGMKFHPAYLYAGLIIILANWVLRNLFFPI